jgi:hypothetical protein
MAAAHDDFLLADGLLLIFVVNALLQVTATATATATVTAVVNDA